MSAGLETTNAKRTIEQAHHIARLARQSGRWPRWRWHDLPDGVPNSSGWAMGFTKVAENGVFTVLVRDVECAWGVVRHAMISDVLRIQPTWSERQRIKDELFGKTRTAVEVLPAADQLVDQAPSYHFWVLPEGFALPFGLHAAA
jgi:hypothetical protein